MSESGGVGGIAGAAASAGASSDESVRGVDAVEPASAERGDERREDLKSKVQSSFDGISSTRVEETTSSRGFPDARRG